MIQVLIADDHSFVAHGLADAVSAMSGYSVAGVAKDGIEAISLVRQLRPECALMDFAMPGANGIEVLYEIRRWSPETRVLIITGHQNRVALSALIDAGVEGLMPKTAPLERILAALRDVANGGSFIDPFFADQLVRSKELPSLSPREGEVLRAIARGQSNAEAALSLGLSPKTIDGHRTNLMRKLDVHGTARLILVAVRKGLLDPDEVD